MTKSILLNKQIRNYFHRMHVIRTKMQQGGWYLNFGGGIAENTFFIKAITPLHYDSKPVMKKPQANVLLERHNDVVRCLVKCSQGLL